MTNWKPLAYVLGAIFVLGIVFSFILSSMNIDSTIPSSDSFITDSFPYITAVNWIQASFIDFIDTGINIFGFNINIPIINPFVFVGSEGQTWLIEQINTITYLPNEVTIPFMIIFILAFLWTAIKLIIP